MGAVDLHGMATPPRPLLSASLIVKDEEGMLPACLAALEGVVDEIVVLDTGSSDRTVEIARAAGAIVIEGEWHDDFGRSRNESMAHCSGRWIIYVDADEVLRVDDVAAFRADLSHSRCHAYTVQVQNVVDPGGSIDFTHDPVRLFRRADFTFAGRVHERVVAKRLCDFETRTSDHLSITHFGYAPDIVAARGKPERNVRLALAEWESNPDDSLARLELARSLSSAGRHEETLEHLHVLRRMDGDAGHTAMHMGISTLLAIGWLDEALRWAEEVAELGSNSIQSAKHHAEVLMQLGRYKDALDVLDAAPAPEDSVAVHGARETVTATQVLRTRLLTVLGREDEAVDLMLALVVDGPGSLWGPMLEVLHRRDELHRAVQPFLDGLDALGKRRASAVLLELSQRPVELGDAFVEQLASHPDGLHHALVFVTANAERLPVERASAWSGVFRAAGFADSCPLLRLMADPSLPVTQRLLAAVLLVGSHRDDRGRPGVHEAAELLDVAELPEAIYVVLELSPTVFDELVHGYVTSQAHALEVADALMSLQKMQLVESSTVHSCAVVALRHGLAVGDPDPRRDAVISDTIGKLQPDTAGA